MVTLGGGFRYGRSCLLRLRKEAATFRSFALRNCAYGLPVLYIEHSSSRRCRAGAFSSSLFFLLVRQAVRAEVQEILGLIRDEDRLLTIDQVAQRLSGSKDWVYRNGNK